jgi:peptide/nickel transport system permease protein
MLKLVGKRLLATVPLLLLVSMLAFGLLYLVPGDPAVTLAGENPAPGQIEALREDLGMDRSVPAQYVSWATDAAQGEFGDSLFSRAPVQDLIFDRLPATISLTLAAVFVAVVLGMSLGLLAVLGRGRFVDRLVTAIATLGVAVPSFWLGLLLIIFFALNRSWFPALGYTPFTEDPVDWLRHITLPAITLGVSPAAEIARQLRASLLDALGNDYIRTARAKGVRRAPVLLKHALKNAGVPAVTVIGVQFSFLLGGSVIVEQIFGIPGVGTLAVSSVLSRDVPVIQGVVLICNLLVDMSYGYFNPKVRAA